MASQRLGIRGMSAKSALSLPMLLVLASFAAHADKANVQDPVAVLDAAAAAQSAGDIEAMLELWDDNGYFVAPAGNRVSGKDKLKGLFTNIVKEKIIGSNYGNAIIKGNTVILHTQLSSTFLNKLGVAPLTMISVNVVDDNKIKSRLFYYPTKSVAKLEAACSSPEHRDVSVQDRPCSEYVQKLKAHTDKLIADGLAKSDD